MQFNIGIYRNGKEKDTEVEANMRKKEIKGIQNGNK